MKMKILCLILALVMLLPLAFSGCVTEDDSKGNIADEASKSTATLKMFMITERHVPTDKEIEDAVNNGESDNAVLEMKAIKEAYENVAKALDKITKAKLKTHLIVTFYTIDEYRAVEDLMKYQAEAATMRKDAKAALNKFKKQQKAIGITDETKVMNAFCEKYPQYVDYIETSEEPDVKPDETIINDRGIEELKYPDADEKQVDIVCVCGYDNYIRYINNGWLNASTESEIETNATAIKTYVNEKFLKLASINKDSTLYAIPNNKPIGEYKYLLVHKDLFSELHYDVDTIDSIGSITGFLQDVARYKNEEYVPLAGDYDLTNAYYWSVNYEYEPYIPNNKSGKVTSKSDLESGRMYYIRDLVSGNSEDAVYEYHMVTLEPYKAAEYYTATGTLHEGEFESGVKYYTKSADGTYIRANKYDEGTDYYTVEFKIEKLDQYDEEDIYSRYFDEESGKIYYTDYTSANVAEASKPKNNEFRRVYLFEKGRDYFTVNNASFNRDEFSVLGSILRLRDTNIGGFVASALATSTDYRDQMLTKKDIIEKGYFDDTAFEEGRKFAAAIVRSEASLASQVVKGYEDSGITYGDMYYFIKLEYPRAIPEEVCDNLIGISSSTNNATRAMEVLTYINTNTEFRNILQYGVEGVDFKVVENIYNGKNYPTVERLRTYYQMDLYKTGNVFVAYPEVGTSCNIWDYGKAQNAESRYDPFTGFILSDYVDMVDFTTVDRVKALTKEFEAAIDACETRAELEETIKEWRDKLNSDPIYSMEKNNGTIASIGNVEDKELGDYNPFGLYHVYNLWWAPLYYTEQ